MERLKNKSGITLIALVITILVLLILAGVTINITLGENGLFNQTKLAAEKYKNTQNMEEEQLQIAANAMMGDVPGNRDENEYVLKSQYDALLERVAALENNTNSQQSTTPTSINTNYSTSEQVVGTWKDGKNIYRKVVDIPSGNDFVRGWNNNYVFVASDIETAIRIDLYCAWGSFNMLYHKISNGYLSSYQETNDTYGRPTFAIVEYTKTTD